MMSSTFPDPQVTKRAFLAIIQECTERGGLEPGANGHASVSPFRRCAIGCGIQAVNRIKGLCLDYGDHLSLASMLGVPLEIVYLADCVYTGLAVEERRDWPARFADAIPESTDITSSVNRIMARILREVALPCVVSDAWGVHDAVDHVCRALEGGQGAVEAGETVYRAAEAASAGDAPAAAYTGYAAAAAHAVYATRLTTTSAHEWDSRDVAQATILSSLGKAKDVAVVAAHAAYAWRRCDPVAAAQASRNAYSSIAAIITEEMARCWFRSADSCVHG